MKELYPVDPLFRSTSSIPKSRSEKFSNSRSRFLPILTATGRIESISMILYNLPFPFECLEVRGRLLWLLSGDSGETVFRSYSLKDRGTPYLTLQWCMGMKDCNIAKCPRFLQRWNVQERTKHEP